MIETERPSSEAAPTQEEEGPAPEIADTTAKRIAVSREQLGNAFLDEGLRIMRNDPAIHGPAMAAKLEARLDSAQLPAGYWAWTSREKAEYLRNNRVRLFSVGALSKLSGLWIQNPLLNQASYDKTRMSDLFQSHPGLLKGGRAHLPEILGQKPTITSVDFILFTNGQEIITVTDPAGEYVLRTRTTRLTSEQLEKNFKIRHIPETTLLYLNQPGQIALLTKKVNIPINETLEVGAVVRAAEELADETGFVPDIHDGNFHYDSKGNLLYVDGDAIDHLTRVIRHPLSAEDKARLVQEIEKYKSRGKTLHLEGSPSH